MSLLKLASLQTVKNFLLKTEPSNSFVVVLPFEPPTQTIGKLKSRRYAAANFPSAIRTSFTTTTAQSTLDFGLWALDFSTTTAAAFFDATSFIKSWPS